MSAEAQAAQWIEQAIALVRTLQQRETELQAPADKVTLVQLIDQAFRCRAASIALASAGWYLRHA